MSEVRDILAETAERMLGDLCPPAVVNAADPGGFAMDLWRAVEASGLHRACLTEAAGGAGLTLAEALPMVRAFARFAAPVPMAEALLAGVLLERAGLPLPEGVVTLAETPVAFSGKAGGRTRAPFARHAAHVVLWHADGAQLRVALLNTQGVRLTPAENLAGEPRDQLDLDAAPLAAVGVASMNAMDLPAHGALLRAAQLVGAMEKTLDLAREHVTTRVQFGRPLSAFQAVSHSLVLAFGESAAAQAAVAAAGALSGERPHFLAVAAAKIRAGKAATAVARAAHQALGAMGYTHEHPLHQYTRRIWSWRDEFGSEAEWAKQLGLAARSKSAEQLWGWITDTEVA